MSEKFRVGLVQMAMSADPRQNLEKAAQRVTDAAKKGAQVVCLPELYRSRYFCRREDQAFFDLPSPTGAEGCADVKQSETTPWLPVLARAVFPSGQARPPAPPGRAMSP